MVGEFPIGLPPHTLPYFGLLCEPALALAPYNLPYDINANKDKALQGYQALTLHLHRGLAALR